MADIKDNREKSLKQFKEGEIIPHVPGFIGSALNVDELLYHFEEPYTTPRPKDIVEYNKEVIKYLKNSFFINPVFNYEDNISHLLSTKKKI